VKNVTRILTLTILAITPAMPAIARLGPSQVTQQSAVETELRRLNNEVSQMQVRKDAAAAERLLADEYLFIQGDGQVSNKSQNVAILRSPDFECQALTTDDVQVRVYGNTALVVGRAHFKATFKGKDVGGDFRYTDVWVRRAGRWQNVASQATRLPPTER
jgi:hypothetical protein